LFSLLWVGYGFDFLNTWLKSRIGSSALKKLRLDVYHHIERLPIREFDKEPVGRLMTRVMNDVDQINQMLSESIVPLFGNLILFLMILTAMFYLDYRIGLLVLILLPPLLFLTDYFRRIQRACYAVIRTEVSRMNSFVQEHLAGVMVIRHFHLEDREFEKFEEINIELSKSYLKTQENFSFYISGNDFLQSIALIGSYFLLSHQVPFDAGTFFTFTLYVMMIFRPLADLAERYNVLQAAFAAADRIFEVLDREIEPDIGKEISDIESIEFKDVWFAYKENEWVLKGFNLKIDTGETVGIVGKTGSGKTTLISLILRFYDVKKGELLINGIPIQDISLSSLRKKFGIILQDPVLFSGTLRDSLTLYDPQISDKEAAKALDFIGFSPNELDRKILERGKSLSSGEMQLISLARVYCHRGKFLLLDEATANVDPLTERKVQEALNNLLRERGALVIAHRLSTLKDVSKIVVMSNGRIVESGTHDELIALKGLYHKLYLLQFAVE
ncbi:MAG: ABC transporter ATP-binding protein, partial [Parachlamydiaceae bacterium]